MGKTSSPLNWRVWLSGASSGLGEALARELAGRGAKLALFARRGELLSKLRDDLLAKSPGTGIPCAEIIVQAGDVRDPARVREAIAEAEVRFGGIDVLILNAGTGDSLFPDKFDVELVERVVGVNFFGAVYGIGAALPGMLARGSGRIVGISSIAGVRGFPGSGPYCASKAALTTFLESLRLDLRGTGVRVITVAPGFIVTPLTDRNQFPMPFRQPVDRAARRIVRGIERGTREIHFPKRFTLLLKVLRCFPVPFYDFVMGRFLPRGLRKSPSREA